MHKNNKLIFLFMYLFLFGIIDGVFFISIGKFLSKTFLGSTSIFLMTEFISLIILAVVNMIDYKFETWKFLFFSHIFKVSMILFVFLFFKLNYMTIVTLSFILIFISSIDKMMHFNLTIKFLDKDRRKKNNSLIIILNQSSRVLGYLISWVLFLKTNKIENIFYFEVIVFIFLILLIKKLNIGENIKSTIKVIKWINLFKLKKELMRYLVFIILISSNGIILASNSVLGFEFGLKNIDKVVIYQSTSILGSVLALVVTLYIKNHFSNNSVVLIGLFIQGICFYLFKIESLRLINFILISMIGFINLSIYITKIQKISEEEIGSKIYTFRQVFRSLDSLIMLFLFKYLSKLFLIEYNIIVMIFCFTILIINIVLIYKNILSYEIDSYSKKC